MKKGNGPASRAESQAGPVWGSSPAQKPECLPEREMGTRGATIREEDHRHLRNGLGCPAKRLQTQVLRSGNWGQLASVWAIRGKIVKLGESRVLQRSL